MSENVMSRIDPTEILSNWSMFVDGMQQSSDLFYKQVEGLIGKHDLKGVKLERVDIAEGGIFSSKREYLQVRRDEYVFHVCAAPFGNGFFISWWFGSFEKGLLASLKRLPIIGRLIGLVLKPWTFYRADTAAMFNAITSDAVGATLDSVIDAQGLKALSLEQKKPVLRTLSFG